MNQVELISCMYRGIELKTTENGKVHCRNTLAIDPPTVATWDRPLILFQSLLSGRVLN